MGSSNEKKRGNGSDRRDLGRFRRRRGPGMEFLENRRLMAGGPPGLGGPPTWRPTDTNLSDAQNGPMANAGVDLIKVYSEFQKYVQAGSQGSFTSSLASRVYFQGNDVGIEIRGYGDPTAFANALKNIGMQVTSVLPQTYDTFVSGYLPIGQLPTAAELGGPAGTIGLTPTYKPSTNYIGVANNEAEAALRANTARNQFGVTGAGQTIGVLSDSVNQFGNGIAASVTTGDIPAANRVTVLADGPAGSSDEGRAMIENIFDISPGVNTAFNTADGGQAAFASGITNLVSQARSTVVTDDVTYPLEPMFQDGIISQAVNTVVSQGVPYFTSAGNNGSTGAGGYESPFRATSANVTGVGQGTYFNFNPNGGSLTNLPFTVPATNGNSTAAMVVQWDNPFYTANGVVTNVFAYVLNANNAVVASGTTNNIAQQTPAQYIGGLAPGSYTLVLQVSQGPNPGVIRFNQVGNPDIIFTHPFGNTGNVTFPTSFGHNAVSSAVGTGAVPWWGTPTFLPNLATDVSEFFSGLGPQDIIFNPDGSRMASPKTVLEPLVSGTDGGNTSFFGFDYSTSTPPYPGQPSTPTNISQPNLPGFFGTSSAAPNLAAVAALMKQLTPNSTPSQIYTAMTTTALPLNGQAKGSWDPQGGYGLVDSVGALNAIDTLRVSSIVPGGGSTIGSPPNFITVTFNKPILFSTINAGDLHVTGPNGAVVTVGAPVGVDSATTPTIVRFPISIQRQPNTSANGIYTDTLSGPIVSVDGKTLIPFSDRFTLSNTAAPKISGTSFNGRIIKITFNTPLDTTTINKQTFLLVRANNAPRNTFGDPVNNVAVSNDPRVVLSYDAGSNTVTFDLTALPQSLLPSDHYAIVVESAADGGTSGLGVTDEVGNYLDGEFGGTFPTGDGRAGGVFVQDLGYVNLLAPTFNFIQLATDSGIPNDQNTNVVQPTFTGQVGSAFPGTVAGVQVIAEFNGLHGGNFDLGLGANGRGFFGNYDALAVTDASGRFSIKAPANLPDGLNRVRFVVIGQPDNPVLPGLSTTTDLSFRVDTSLPTIDYNAVHPSGASLPFGAQISTLTNLSLYFVDPVSPTSLSSPFAVPTLLSYPALDPSTASNISNYSLYQTNAAGTTVLADESSFIATATYVSTTNRRLTRDPFTGTVNLTFNSGLPAGTYIFVAHTAEPGFSGVRDAAGNPLGANSLQPSSPQDFYLKLNFQPSPAYITSVSAISPDGSVGQPRAYYEEPLPGTTPRAEAPPTQFKITFSNPLNPAANYTDAVQLIASADAVGGTPDGNFGTLGTSNDGTGYSRVNPAGTTVTVSSSNGRATAGQPGFDDTLTLNLPAGYTLPADYYRLYLPNNSPTTRIIDQFGGQLDGEFLGDQTASGAWEDLLPNGQYRAGLSGDGLPGGAFMTGYVVVPNGNIIYANPSAPYDPITPSTFPDGSLQRPYPVLAPQATYTGANGGNLNSPGNASSFDPNYDRAGVGKFEPSALYAAQVASAKGPVVVVALPGTIIRDPSTGQTTQRTFVLQAPTTTNGTITSVNDASVAVPAMTTLAFAPGSTLKLQNASLLIQNQGSALEVNGGFNPGQGVVFTSYADNSIGSINPNESTPRAGDWGGILLRNYNEQGRSATFPGQLQISPNVSDYGRLKGPGGADALSGADDIMSVIQFATVRYGGGQVPLGNGVNYDSIEMQNSRPAVTNVTINASGSSGGLAAISENVDSLREDSAKRGALLRRLTLANNSINGIYIRAEDNGFAEPTDAMTFAPNASAAGGQRNFTMDAPYPYVLSTPLRIGQVFLVETGLATTSEPDRLYVQPGAMVKLTPGAGIEVVNASDSTGQQRSSFNVGERTYINEFDANHNISPSTPGFKANGTAVASNVFTSIYDNAASTAFFDPVTGISTTIVAPIDTGNSGGTYQPTPGVVDPRARWGGIQVDSPGLAVINNATIEYGGGFVNSSTGTETRHALELRSNEQGNHVMVTNNNFYDNGSQDPSLPQTPIFTPPDGFIAGNQQEPLVSGTTFIHGNLMLRNGINGVGVQDANGSGTEANYEIDREFSTINVNTVWAGGDFTYVVRGTIALGPFGNLPPTGNPNGLTAPLPPAVTFTVQSTLPGTVLADGSVVAKPGVSAVIKLLNPGVVNGPVVNGTSAPQAPAFGNTTTAAIGLETNQGAGFVSGIDNGVDPTADPLIDIGVQSSMRFLGIPGDQSGQQRVPVVITSLFDSTVGTTVRGVTMNQAITGSATTPKPGDGGNIIYGSLTATNLNLQDARFGNRIDNVDIKYITRIEQVGGGLTNLYDVTGKNSYDIKVEPSYEEKFGLPLNLAGNTQPFTANQTNGPNTLTIAGSNLSTFRDMGVYVHWNPFGGIFVPQNYTGTISRNVIADEPTYTYLVNDTISNMTTGNGVGVELTQQNANDNTFTSPNQAVLLNNTFYNDNTGVETNGTKTAGSKPPATYALNTPSTNFNGMNSQSEADVLVMNNIFSKIPNIAIHMIGQDYGSQAQYNLFDQVGTQVLLDGDAAINRWLGNNFPLTGSPDFVNPDAGNFNLGPNSAAIDSARSEIGPLGFGATLFPAVTPTLDNVGGIKNTIGFSNFFGALFSNGSPQSVVALPGTIGVDYGVAGYSTDWVPTLPGTPQSYFSVDQPQGTGVYPYTPRFNPRDQNGNQRKKDPNDPNIGGGSQFIEDIGAFEYIQTFPPHVTGVTATYTDPTSPTGVTSRNIYSVGGVAGTNVTPQTISITFDQPLLPSTINAATVELIASGGTGLFNVPPGGGAVAGQPHTINLSGKLSFDQPTDTLVIDTSGLNLTNDEYRIVLFGNGQQILTDTQGYALDGFNLDANGNQRALPSGTGTPGSNFQVTFTIDTHPPSLVPTSFYLDPATDTNRRDAITRVNQPNFQGNITDIFPPLNSVQGDTVFIDISTKGDGNFDLLNAGIGTTDASGHYSVKINAPLPDSPYNVGANGYLAFDYTKNPPVPQTTNFGYSLARVRVVDQSGNVSDTPGEPLSTFISHGAVTSFVVDTRGPIVSSVTPGNNTLVNPSGTTIPVTLMFTKNVDPASFNNSTIQVVRSGGDGVFGNGNDVTLAIDPASLRFTYLPSPFSPQGPEQVTFNIVAGAGSIGNDIYHLVLKGTGGSVVIDIAGNPIYGNSQNASDFTTTFTLYSSSLVHNLFVGGTISDPTATKGSRANPYAAIGGAINAAIPGDVVAVLPGVYTEVVTLKSLVTVRSADPASTDGYILPGDPIQTIIRAPQPNGLNSTTTVFGVNLQSIGGSQPLFSELTGFTIASPLQGDPANGPIQSNSVGLMLINSNALIDRDYFIDSAVGLQVTEVGTVAPVPLIANDVFTGNTVGIGLDGSSATSIVGMGQISNSDFTYNSDGLIVTASPSSPVLANIANNIFWQNHSLDASRAGLAIGANVEDKVTLHSNLFSGNGPNQSSPADDTYNVSSTFNPANLVANFPDATGNFTGNPAFVSPRDARPGADGPAVFFLDANFDLTSTSSAIDRSNPINAPSTDFLYRSRIYVPGHAFAGTGPADVGAFEFNGTGGVVHTPPIVNPGNPGGGIFAVRASSTPSGAFNNSAPSGAFNSRSVVNLPASQAPTTFDVSFTNTVDRSTVTPNDLVISGSGVSSSDPVHATSLTWIDDETVQFNLTGGYNQNGTVLIQIPQGAVRDIQGRGLPGSTNEIDLTGASTTVQIPPVSAPTTGQNGTTKSKGVVLN